MAKLNRISTTSQRLKLAMDMGMSGDFMKSVLAAIHEESVRQQIEILNQR